MNLDKELIALKAAATSIEATDSESETLALVQKGAPFDQIFFENLSDPRWLPRLRMGGYFASLPAEKMGSDGTITFPRSLPLRGLQNLTASAPEVVTEILEDLPDSKNPHVIDQIMRCIASIQNAELIPRCTEILLRRLDTGSGTHWVWIEEILNDWLRLGSVEDSLRLFECYVNSLIAGRKSRYESGDGWQLSEIDHNYIEGVASANPRVLATILVRCLISWKRRAIELASRQAGSEDELFENVRSDGQVDPPTYWLEDFKQRKSSGHEIEEILATRLFEAGSAIFSSGNETAVDEFDELLRADPWKLFSRLRWQLYADHPENTCARARTDFIPYITNLSRYSGAHGYEMAQMLQAQSRAHGSDFLTPPEVEQFYAMVMKGPLDHEGQLVTEERFALSFRRKQLDPIRDLLTGPARDTYEALAAEFSDLPMSSYKPISSGGEARTIEQVAPKQAERMASMLNEELWHFLNTWKPDSNRYDSDQWWIEEHVSALGPMFAELLNSQPERFPASSAWWRNLTRPVVLYKPLELAAARVAKKKKETSEGPVPTENEWRNWFGLSDWIAELGGAAAASEAPTDDAARPEDKDWNWPRISTVKFLAAAIDPLFPVPDDLKPEIGRLLRKFVEDPDQLLATKDRPWMDDWLTTAINSIRGTALEDLLVLAFHQKKERSKQEPDQWIFETIQSTLSTDNQSPAIFAIMGARLNLALYVFGEQFKQHPSLLIPQGQPLYRNAFIHSQVRYGNPLRDLIEILPSYPLNALDSLAELNARIEGDGEQRGDFGGQLGFHLFFYYWNACYSDADSAKAIVDKYFDIAKPSQRGRAIRDAGRVFSKTAAVPENEPIIERARELWDRRAVEIESSLADGTYCAEDVHEELGAFVTWLECECHPFEWRSDRVLQAIKLLEKPPQAAFTMRTLEALSSTPERLGACTEILEALLSKESHIVSWAYREKHLKPILNRGLQSGDQVVEERVHHIQEILLRQGLFEYLELDTAD